jgi:hypothetical protein
MRSLEINKQPLWLVTITGHVDAVDDDGNFTGESIPTYSTPIPIKIAMFPSSGIVDDGMQGVLEKFDMVATSTSIELITGDLLFNSQPTSKFDSTYDYKVAKILSSLNSYRYGLEARV